MQPAAGGRDVVHGAMGLPVGVARHAARDAMRPALCLRIHCWCGAHT